jgi:hypothetical protein
MRVRGLPTVGSGTEQGEQEDRSGRRHAVAALGLCPAFNASLDTPVDVDKLSRKGRRKSPVDRSAAVHDRVLERGRPI